MGRLLGVHQMCHCSVLCMAFKELTVFFLGVAAVDQSAIFWEPPLQAPPNCKVCLACCATPARTSLALEECYHIVSDEGHQTAFAIIRSENAIHFSRAERFFCSQHPKIPTDFCCDTSPDPLNFCQSRLSAI